MNAKSWRILLNSPVRLNCLNLGTRHIEVIKNLQSKLYSPSPQQSENYESIPSKVSIKNSLKRVKLDTNRIEAQIKAIKYILGVTEFKVDVLICSDIKMRSLNKEWRGKSKSTDILSFPANEFISPGVFADDPSLEFSKHLGDVVLAPDTIRRQMARDLREFQENGCQQVEYENDDGVSLALSTVFNLQGRVGLLLVHGLLHLLEYDHESDEQWKHMTSKENDVIQELKLKFPELCTDFHDQFVGSEMDGNNKDV